MMEDMSAERVQTYTREFYEKVKGMFGAIKAQTALRAVLFFVPLWLALAWRTTLSHEAYARFAAVDGHLINTSSVLARTPLYAAVLFLASQTGVPLDVAGTLLSAFGWGTLNVVLYETGRALRRPLGATLGAALMTFTPCFIGTLGTELPWVLVGFWLAITSCLRRRPHMAVGALALMLTLYPSPVTLTAAFVLLVLQWREVQTPPPYLGGGILLIVALGWGVASWQGLLSLPSIAPGTLFDGLQQLQVESDFYWLVPPLIACGYVALFRSKARPVLVAALLWPMLALLESDLARAGAGVAAVLLVGLGNDWLLQQAKEAERLPSTFWLRAGLALLAVAPLTLAQVSSLLQRYNTRPETAHALEAKAATWLDNHTAPASTVLASPHVAYRARRRTYTWPQRRETALPAAEDFAQLPAYAISSQSLRWKMLERQVWFRSTYIPLERFSSPYAATSPVTVWGQRPTVTLPPDVRPLKALLPEHAAWVGYRYDPSQLQPGAPLSVTLYLQIPPPLSTTPYTETYRGSMQVSMLDRHDAVVEPVWRQKTQVLKRSAESILLTEHFVLPIPPELGVGAYRLMARINPYHSPTSTPLYVAGEPYPTQALFLDYLRIPWQGSLEGTQPSGARLGETIRLVAYEFPSEATPGETIEAHLYWEALAPPSKDYTVFVHLLEMDGSGIAGHDARPLGGRYPTQTWVPGNTVPDIHPLTVPEDLPTGTYKLQLGMYAWPEMTRLPVTLPNGTETPESTVILGEIKVR